MSRPGMGVEVRGTRTAGSARAATADPSSRLQPSNDAGRCQLRVSAAMVMAPAPSHSMSRGPVRDGAPRPPSRADRRTGLTSPSAFGTPG
jgi:hypothetical protein